VRLGRRPLLAAAASLFILCMSFAAGAEVPEARAVVDAFHAKLVEMMKSAKTLGFDGRMRALEPAVAAAFNLPFMARVSVGPQWQSFTADEQRQYIELFSRYSEATYANRFDDYNDERFQTLDDRPQAGGSVVVETEMQKKAAEPVQLAYLMTRGDKGWQIVDVFANGTFSQLAVLRSEFTAVLKRDGVAGLLQTLQRKIDQLRTKS
jgi:phospholipid transport system substrate-binding protein